MSDVGPNCWNTKHQRCRNETADSGNEWHYYSSTLALSCNIFSSSANDLAEKKLGQVRCLRKPCKSGLSVDIQHKTELYANSKVDGGIICRHWADIFYRIMRVVCRSVRACTERDYSPAVLQCLGPPGEYQRTWRVADQPSTAESSTDQESTSWPGLSTGHQNDRHACRQRNHCMCCLSFIAISKVMHWLPAPKNEAMFLGQSLSVLNQDSSKSYERIVIKFYGRIESCPRTNYSHFGGNQCQDSSPRLLNPDPDEIYTATASRPLCSPGGSIIIGRGLRLLITCGFVTCDCFQINVDYFPPFQVQSICVSLRRAQMHLW